MLPVIVKAVAEVRALLELHAWLGAIESLESARIKVAGSVRGWVTLPPESKKANVRWLFVSSAPGQMNLELRWLAERALADGSMIA